MRFIQSDDDATNLYTSGSIGHPKDVVSSHRNILTALLSWELDRSIGELVAGVAPSAGAPTSPQPGTLLCAPLFHVTGLHASYLSSYRTQRKLRVHVPLGRRTSGGLDRRRTPDLGGGASGDDG